MKRRLCDKTRRLKKKSSVTTFEDMSNELVYEIFDYFDCLFIYETFSKLNRRFQFLFLNQPLKLKLLSLSKSKFQRDYQSVVDAQAGRILSVSMSKYDLNFVKLNLFTNLQCLMVYKIEPCKIVSLVRTLTSLAKLSSLSIYSSDYFQNENSIYLSVFSLLKLKFFKLTFPSGGQRVPLPLSAVKCETLERLILNGYVRLDQLISIMSCLPKLNYLSCESLYGCECTEMNVKAPPCSLTIIRLILNRMRFDELNLFLSKIGFYCKRLHIKYSNDKDFLDAERWKELISNHLPCLLTFDLQYISPVDEDFNHRFIDGFYSEFWSQRNWLFDYYYFCSDDDDVDCINFFSVVLYRYNHFLLHKPIDNAVCRTYQSNIVNFARHLTIEDDLRLTKCSIRFPRVTKLSLRCDFPNENSRLFCLTQITELDLRKCELSIGELTNKLMLLPNLQSLTLPNPLAIESKCNDANLFSRKNQIRKLTIDDDVCLMKHIHCLTVLFPHLEYLKVGVSDNQLEDILRYLLIKLKSLFSLFIFNMNYDAISKIQKLIQTESLIQNPTIENIHGGLYLWW